MKDGHETQSTEQLHHSDDKTFTPIEVLQRTTGGVWNRKSFRLDSQPKGVRWIGHVIAGFVLLLASMVLLQVFD